MRTLGLSNSLGKAFSETVTNRDQQFNCTVLLFNGVKPINLEDVYPSLSTGFRSEFNHTLLINSVGYLPALMTFTDNKFVIKNAAGVNDLNSIATKKKKIKPKPGQLSFRWNNISNTVVLTPITTELDINIVYIVPDLMYARSIHQAGPNDPATTVLSAYASAYCNPRFNNKPRENAIHIFGTTERSERFMTMEFRERKHFNRMIFRIAYSYATTYRIRVWTKNESGTMTLAYSFLMNVSHVSRWLEIVLPEFETDCISVSATYVTGGAHSSGYAQIWLQEIAFGHSEETIEELEATWGLVTFGTRDYDTYMTDRFYKLKQNQLPLILLDTGTQEKEINCNISQDYEFLKLESDISISMEDLTNENTGQ